MLTCMRPDPLRPGRRGLVGLALCHVPPTSGTAPTAPPERVNFALRDRGLAAPVSVFTELSQLAIFGPAVVVGLNRKHPRRMREVQHDAKRGHKPVAVGLSPALPG